MKRIIIKNEDWGVIILIPNYEIYGDEEGKKPFEEEKALKEYISKGHDWFICDHEDIPNFPESRRQLYHDGNKIKVDHKWEIKLMASELIQKKHLSKLDSKLDEELSKKDPDSIVIHRLQREKEKSIKYSEKDWYEQALKNLDEKVFGGEKDKPSIRKKLLEKTMEKEEIFPKKKIVKKG